MTTAAPPTGKQVRISHGDHEVWTVAVGAGLRSYTIAGRGLVDGYGEFDRCDGGRGQTLVPWPNRIAGGTYSLDGATHQLALTEPKAGNAIHGLARWVPWELLDATESACTWSYTIPPQPGWPTSLACTVTYALDEAGLTVTTAATNLGRQPCLYGTGHHPYLSVGSDSVDGWTLEVPAQTWLRTDSTGIPVGSAAVGGTEFDFRQPRQIAGTVLDTCFGDLATGADGGWRVLLSGPDGSVAIWGDRTHKWVQIFSGDTLSTAARRRGLAVEPMTCPADAFNSGAGALRLEPGGAISSAWGIST